MKTGKKLLSLFLAVVMMVTTCSVGFTAFAANRDNGIWKDSTSAKSTFDALTELVDTFRLCSTRRTLKKHWKRSWE